MRDLLARLLARLGDAEVQRLIRERDRARSDRSRSAEAAVRWHGAAVIHQAEANALATRLARADAPADQHTKEQQA